MEKAVSGSMEADIPHMNGSNIDSVKRILRRQHAYEDLSELYAKDAQESIRVVSSWSIALSKDVWKTQI